jgi:hypothetical protein
MNRGWRAACGEHLETSVGEETPPCLYTTLCLLFCIAWGTLVHGYSEGLVVKPADQRTGFYFPFHLCLSRLPLPPLLALTRYESIVERTLTDY